MYFIVTMTIVHFLKMKRMMSKVEIEILDKK